MPYTNEPGLSCGSTRQAKAIRALRGRKETGMTTDELMELLRGTECVTNQNATKKGATQCKP